MTGQATHHTGRGSTGQGEEILGSIRLPVGPTTIEVVGEQYRRDARQDPERVGLACRAQAVGFSLSLGPGTLSGG